MKYAFLKTCLDSKLIGRKKLISVRKAAALLRISTSGYYQWLKVDRYHRHGVHHSDAELLCHVRSVISRCGKQVPGVMRLYLALRQQGLSVGFKRLRRLLRSNGIFHRYHRKYVATTDSNHNLARLPNLIDRQFNRYAINQAWCGDITYIPTDEGWLFMASVLDLASRCLVGYSFDSTMKTSLVVDALRMAIANEHPAPGLIFHSDQGSQYCSHVFQEFLLRQGISGSMSERGQSAEHGYASFTSTLFVSPYQNHELLRQTAQAAAEAYGVEFLYRDFRPGFRAGQQEARERGFYMQKYCGCVFSEEDRYRKQLDRDLKNPEKIIG